MKKILSTLVLVFVFLYMLWQLFFVSPLKAATACFASESEFFKPTYHQALEITDKAERTSFICSTDQDSYERLSTCLEAAKSRTIVGGWVLNDLPYEKANSRSRFNEFVFDHNGVCHNQLSPVGRI